MKNIVLALMFVLLAVPAFAKVTAFDACTADHKVSRLSLDLSEDVKPAVVTDIGRAFKAAGKNLSAEALASREGFLAFAAELTDEDKEAVEHLQGPPTVVGECK